jgi:hypothetical protein
VDDINLYDREISYISMKSFEYLAPDMCAYQITKHCDSFMIIDFIIYLLYGYSLIRSRSTNASIKDQFDEIYTSFKSFVNSDNKKNDFTFLKYAVTFGVTIPQIHYYFSLPLVEYEPFEETSKVIDLTFDIRISKYFKKSNQLYKIVKYLNQCLADSNMDFICCIVQLFDYDTLNDILVNKDHPSYFTNKNVYDEPFTDVIEYIVNENYKKIINYYSV